MVSGRVYTKFQFGKAGWNLTALRSQNSPVSKTVLWSVCTACARREKPSAEGLGSLWGCTSALLSAGSLRGWELGMQNACGLLKAHLLEINSGRSHSQGTTARFFKWNPAVFKGQWWKMMSLVYPFLGHRFFSVAWTVFLVLLAGMYHMELAFLHWVFAPSSTARY